MDIYLMRHGLAVSEDLDPARPLTDVGRADVARVADRARAAGVRIDVCVHSGILRAEQTAQILAAGLGIERVEAGEGLRPNSPFMSVALRLAGGTDDRSFAIVSHLPFLDRLASLLVAGDHTAQVVQFHNAGLVRLVPKAAGTGFCIDWVLVPDLA